MSTAALQTLLPSVLIKLYMRTLMWSLEIDEHIPNQNSFNGFRKIFDS